MRGLPIEVKNFLNKARDSALLAVDTYNRPNAQFRTGAYVVLMVIGWTALFHSVFVRKRIRPIHRRPSSRRFIKIEGEYKWWELSECVKQYYKDLNPAQRKNLEFFILLRNKIEHRSLPPLDVDIFGECQALLLNFEEFLCQEFGEKYALRSTLNFALQFGRTATSTQTKAMRKSVLRHYSSVKNFVDNFRSGLNDEIAGSPEFAFKVFLIPKIGNHAKSSDIAVEFVKYDPSKPEEMQKYEHLVALVKPKEVPVVNLGYLTATKVVREVVSQLGKKFTLYSHLRCYQHFGVRPKAKDPNPTLCNTNFCLYDDVHKDYVYKPEWVRFLVEKLSDQTVYELIHSKKNGSS